MKARSGYKHVRCGFNNLKREDGIGSCKSHSGLVMWGRGGYSGSHVGVWRAIMKGKQYKKKCSTVETYNQSNLTKLDRTLGVRDRKSGN